MSGDINESVLQAIQDLETEVNTKQTIGDALAQKNELFDRINDL
jgi:hypothetical protein